MKSFASAKTYSLIVGCHGMGWLPVAQSKARAATKPRYYWEYSHTPLTRFFGGLTAEYQTEVTTLAKSLSNCGLKWNTSCLTTATCLRWRQPTTCAT